MVRSIAAVVVGYLVFALGTSLTVLLLFISSAVAAPAAVVIVAVIGLAATGLAAGAVTALLARTGAQRAALVVAAIAAAMMVVNIVVDRAAEPLWFKVCVIAVAAPAIVAGGRLAASMAPGEPAPRHEAQ